MRAMSHAFSITGVSAKAKLVAIGLSNQGDASIVWADLCHICAFACCPESSIQGILKELRKCGFIRKAAAYNGKVSVQYGFPINEDCENGEAIAHLFYKEYPRSKTNKARIPEDLRLEVYERDSYQCLACGCRDNLSVDHVIAECYGGPTDITNLQTLCRDCNSKKRTSYRDYRRVK